MSLYFLRHGLAAERLTWEGDDSLRPLTKKGIQAMLDEAKRMVALDLALDLILSSPLTRAFQTADIVAGRLKLQDNLFQDERLSPGFDLDDLESILQDHPEAQNVMLVGHEPDFSLTLGALIGGGRILFKKGGLARVELISRQPLQGELAWMASPKILLAR
jgi:phosphohistidine phosphatase